ncbi:hypothetical protein FVEG_02569 [Fusarium verticillioides 7600]|uniref:Uncharacterized protein n=1 Tax=Gibberella moniliformis (strain M3125 / FGSC 7600) TaxID=334819 RepID=W7LX40_GIBM7|nr:hypothetical protein FVEG_02569 [Fusarium verticillioides 7600]EWG39959.1 hypothetical protein FVEG_02569 [Fusarium verticillioides 7600]
MMHQRIPAMAPLEAAITLPQDITVLFTVLAHLIKTPHEKMNKVRSRTTPLRIPRTQRTISSTSSSQ